MYAGSSSLGAAPPIRPLRRFPSSPRSSLFAVKVRDLAPAPLAIEEDILRLQVAMFDAGLVQILEQRGRDVPASHRRPSRTSRSGLVGRAGTFRTKPLLVNIPR